MDKKSFSELPLVTHKGKYAVVYDIAHDNGSLYYLSMVGPRQMLDGIGAALLDSGKRNSEEVFMRTPPENGEKLAFAPYSFLNIAGEAVGTMKRITRKVAGTRVYQTILISQLARWDYNYAHIKAKSEVSDEQTDYQKAQAEDARRRFVLLADNDEPIERTARRWFAYLPRRVDEPLLAEWALPLWEHCLSSNRGITPMTRFRGDAWLCEPTSANLRDSVTELGRRGELPLPADFPCGGSIYGYPPDEYALAAD